MRAIRSSRDAGRILFSILKSGKEKMCVLDRAVICIEQIRERKFRKSSLNRCCPPHFEECFSINEVYLI